MVPTTLRSAGKMNGAAQRRIVYQLKEQKFSQMKQKSNRFCFIIFSHTNNMSDEFNSGLNHRGIEDEYTVYIVFSLLY